MEKPSRKQNRLPDYDYSREGSYFVTLCTHNRARLFEMETPAGKDLCVIPDNGTAHRPCPTKGNLIIHKWIRETENKSPVLQSTNMR